MLGRGLNGRIEFQRRGILLAGFIQAALDVKLDALPVMLPCAGFGARCRRKPVERPARAIVVQTRLFFMSSRL